MTFMRHRLPLLLIAILLSACGPQEVLQSKSAAVPYGIDLSGRWTMRPESKKGQPGINEAINRTDGIDNKRLMQEMINAQRGGGRRSGKTRGGLVGVFLESGDALKITQTEHGLFISFDRSVVEEFRFGEYRPISVGQADAMRVSGWEGEDYVVETLGEKGMKLTDRYSLSTDRQGLTRHITLRGADLQEVTIVQEFDRENR